MRGDVKDEQAWSLDPFEQCLSKRSTRGSVWSIPWLSRTSIRKCHDEVNEKDAYMYSLKQIISRRMATRVVFQETTIHR